MHSTMYPFISQYYQMKLYTEKDLDLFVSVNMITSEEKQEILSKGVN